MSRISKLLDFMIAVGKLKAVKRTGWIQRRVKDPESVAGHMYRMSILALLSKDSKTNLNRDRCIKMALVHDMAECIVGDITPADKISKEEKHKREKDAMNELRDLVSRDIGDEMYGLWEEYENQLTEEAKFVKDLDKFDMILQAFEYEQIESRPGQLQDFFNSTQGKFEHPMVKEWVEELYDRREKFRNGVGDHNSFIPSTSEPLQITQKSEDSFDAKEQTVHSSSTSEET